MIKREQYKEWSKEKVKTRTTRSKSRTAKQNKRGKRQPLEVLKLPYQPVVEYEQADVSTANCNEIFLIFIINNITILFFFIFETINIMKSAVSFLIKE
ncbi:hypothetical protein T11_17502 [Trichinella zimbabwensis]|uniref:Uncharacterized protein n=1 Tax=Trichinella zimbabwensis TaxID=268475 RepID=A0A0V1HC06_9BILA|nr:hypothetical protein T11_17502 [Trichinella zimbabwensis]